MRQECQVHGEPQRLCDGAIICSVCKYEMIPVRKCIGCGKNDTETFRIDPNTLDVVCVNCYELYMWDMVEQD